MRSTASNRRSATGARRSSSRCRRRAARLVAGSGFRLRPFVAGRLPRASRRFGGLESPRATRSRPGGRWGGCRVSWHPRAGPPVRERTHPELAIDLAQLRGPAVQASASSSKKVPRDRRASSMASREDARPPGGMAPTSSCSAVALAWHVRHRTANTVAVVGLAEDMVPLQQGALDLDLLQYGDLRLPHTRHTQLPAAGAGPAWFRRASAPTGSGSGLCGRNRSFGFRRRCHRCPAPLVSGTPRSGRGQLPARCPRPACPELGQHRDVTGGGESADGTPVAADQRSGPRASDVDVTQTLGRKRRHPLVAPIRSGRPVAAPVLGQGIGGVATNG